MDRRVVGRLVASGIGAVLLVGTVAGPAAASHDDFGDGTVVIQVGPGVDEVMVVRAVDADAAALEDEVRDTAAAADIGVREVSVGENSEPDTTRAVADVALSVRESPLVWRVPGEAIDAWRALGEVVVEPARWVESATTGAPEEGEGLSYRVDATVFVLAVAMLLIAAIVPFAVLRVYGARVVAAGGDTGDRVHRLRRVTTAIQLLVPLLLIAALIGLGLADWPLLALAVTVGITALPTPLVTVLGLVGYVLPLLAAYIGATLGALPHDRALRGTTQSAREGTSQMVRGVALGLLPVLGWLLLVPLLPEGLGPWFILPLALVFGVGIAAVTPVLIARVQATGEMDPELRERVLAQCEDAGLGVRDVKLLSSQGSRTSNAAIAGVVPQLRYVFLTDELVSTMDEREVRAVVAHEIAHGKEHHILIKLAAGFLAIAVASGMVFGLLFGVLEDVPGMVIAVGLPVLMIGSLLFAHGVIGIRLEQRADDYAARQTDPAALAGALEKMAETNGTKRRTGWLWNVLQQHPGLDGRLRRLQQTQETTPVPTARS